MSRAAGVRLVLLLLLAAPIPPIGFADIIGGEPGEPLLDYVIMYVVALAILTPAAALTSGYFMWKRFNTPQSYDLIIYALVGAIGPTAVMIILDAWDSYFSRPGVGWAWPLTGLVLGLLFGATFRGIGALLEKRSADELREG